MDVGIDHTLRRLTGRAPAESAKSGPSVLDLGDADARAALGRLHADVGAHASARLPWLRAWEDAFPHWRPWVLALRDGATGDLRAAAALARDAHAGIVRVRCLGDASLDCAPIVSRTPGDARELADAVVDALRGLRRPWTLWLRQVSPDDEVTSRLMRRLPAADIRAGLARPVVVLDGVRQPRAVLSRNLRQAEAKARNRIARAGLALDMTWVTDRAGIERRLPGVRSVHLARDLQLRGASKLDEPQEAVFYDALLHRHLDALELLELRLDGELAAYVLWVRNGADRLVLDNRVAPVGTGYSTGLIANNAALCRAAADPRIDVLDWGTGVQRYKLQSATRVVEHCELCAWSSWRLRYALAARRACDLGRGRRFARSALVRSRHGAREAPQG
jgi:hypothetical protein